MHFESDRPALPLWDQQIPHSLIKGYAGFSTDQELVDALKYPGARLEAAVEVQRRAKEVTILTVNELPAGTIVLGQARRCATPGCSIFFVPTHPHQKYPSKNCPGLGKNHKRPKVQKTT